MTVYDPASALLFAELLEADPPHEVSVIVRQANRATVSTGAHRQLLDRRPDCVAIISKASMAISVSINTSGILCRPFPLNIWPIGSSSPCEEVATDTVTDCAAVPLNATELGDTEHVDIAGPPLQLAATFCANPAVAAMDSV